MQRRLASFFGNEAKRKNEAKLRLVQLCIKPMAENGGWCKMLCKAVLKRRVTSFLLFRLLLCFVYSIFLLLFEVHSNMDTIGTKIFVLGSEVSLF